MTDLQPAPAAQPAPQRTSVFQRAPFVVIECDASLRITAWNHAAARLFGHPSEQALGQDLAELLPPRDADDGWQDLLRAPHGGDGAARTWTHARQDGGEVACEWTLEEILDDSGARAGVICYGRDMTAHVELSRQCAKAETILRAIQDNLPIAIWRVDARGLFTYHEGKGVTMAGLEPGWLVGKNIFEFYPEVRLDYVRRALAGEGSSDSNEAYGRSYDHWTIPSLDDRGQVDGVVGVTIDTTEKRDAERALRDQLALAERQRQVIQQLSTPIIQVWDGVLTLPMVGVVDSVRTAEVMDQLLDAVARTRSRFAILDLTGVEAVDTQTASYLIELVRAIRLLGAEGIITGIRASVAQTVVAIGVDLGGVTTLANLRAGLRHCIVQMRKQDAAAGAPAPRPAASPAPADRVSRPPPSLPARGGRPA